MSYLRGMLRQPWIRKAAYTSAVTLQVACVVHLVNEHVFEVRNSTGESMLPTLAPEGDFLLQLRLPFAKALASVSNAFGSTHESTRHAYYRTTNIGGSAFSKTDQAQATGLKVGDLVVALSPFDPTRSVCKRVIALPGDTVALDPRMRPLPIHAWRSQTPSPSPSPSPSSTISATAHTNPTPPKSEVDLLNSTHTNPPIHSKDDVQYITIPLGHVWLAGDNMANSTDSRHYGPVPLGLVRAKVLARVYPNPVWLTNNLRLVE